MEKILKFNIPEENVEFERANLGNDLCSILWNFDQLLRSKYKYEEVEEASLYDVRDWLRDVMLDYNITFDHRIFE